MKVGVRLVEGFGFIDDCDEIVEKGEIYKAFGGVRWFYRYIGRPLQMICLAIYTLAPLFEPT